MISFHVLCYWYILQFVFIIFISHTGFVGHHCGVDVDECESDPCQHGSKCVDLVNAYSCECLAGWEGHHCQNNVMCVENPCQNGGKFYCSTSYVSVCIILASFQFVYDLIWEEASIGSIFSEFHDCKIR